MIEPPRPHSLVALQLNLKVSDFSIVLYVLSLLVSQGDPYLLTPFSSSSSFFVILGSS